MEKQMIRASGVQPLTSTDSWRSIDWKKAHKEVRRLQMRIAKAVQEGKHGKVKSLQWILTHSFYAKALAVKRVTSNKGRKTPGIRRHRKIKADANPYLAEYGNYFYQRRHDKDAKFLAGLTSRQTRLALQQLR